MKTLKELRVVLPLVGLCLLAVFVTGSLHRSGSQITGLERQGEFSYTNSFADSAGNGAFLYCVDFSGVQAETLRVPTATVNHIVLTEITWSWTLADGDEDKFRFTVYSGKHMADSLFWWYGEPDEYMKAGFIHWPLTQPIVLPQDSSLVVRTSTTAVGSDDTYTLTFAGYETTGD